MLKLLSFCFRVFVVLYIFRGKVFQFFLYNVISRFAYFKEQYDCVGNDENIVV